MRSLLIYVHDCTILLAYMLFVSIMYWRSFATSLSLLLPNYWIISRQSSKALSCRIDFFHWDIRNVLSRQLVSHISWITYFYRSYTWGCYRQQSVTSESVFCWVECCLNLLLRLRWMWRRSLRRWVLQGIGWDALRDFCRSSSLASLLLLGRRTFRGRSCL